MEKYKKANERRNNLSFGKKLAKIPLRGLVGRQVCKQEILHGEPESYLVAKKLAFEIVENPADSARRLGLKF